ncbi:Lrp/AsnC family transcriptional regulator [uncultured Succinivibrio sp.]|uniref:Lrp/AsnC family transcriptional regulator n=1 Tax=uncultured Succinivibrio sp. TaxID=540749 RepID=UPI0025DEAED5|nr:Lrp/AsnC family transcriptional regulator [uncultured Succinivibrio sp.]
MIELDTSDLQLLCALREDCRLSLRDLGEKCSLSAPAVSARIRRLEQARVIRGYTVSLSDSAFALEVEALIYTKVRFDSIQAYLEYMKSALAVSACMKIADEYSYMAIASFRSISQLNNFVLYLEENFGQCRISIILKKEFINRVPLNFDKKN